MDTILENVKAFFGLPTNASRAEVDQHLQAQLDAQHKGSKAEPEAPAPAAAAPEAPAPEPAAVATPAPAAEAPAAQENEALTAILAAMKGIETSLGAIDTRLKVVEGSPAATPTGGQRSAATIATENSDDELIMAHPINQITRRKA